MTAPVDRRAAARASSHWLHALRAYLGVIAAGNLLWESLQLPLYTIWSTGTAAEQAFAVVHCTMGDLLIALSALIASLIIAGDESWPADHFWPVAGCALTFGVLYTVFSEWHNVSVRATWTYSDWMPVISMFGLRIGLSPLLQWIVVPAAAFAIIKAADKRTNGARQRR